MAWGFPNNKFQMQGQENRENALLSVRLSDPEADREFPSRAALLWSVPVPAPVLLLLALPTF